MTPNGVPVQRQVWDEEYLAKGRLWRGATSVPVVPDGSRVLELGCGNGKTLVGAIEDQCSFVGLDHSSQALRACPLGLDLVLGDATRLPFRDGAFDRVWCVHVLGHMMKAQRMSAAVEVTRVLRPGGRVWFRDFHVSDIRNGNGREVEDSTYLRGRGILYHYFEVDEMTDLFPKAEIVELKVDTLRKRYHGSGQRAEVDALLQV